MNPAHEIPITAAEADQRLDRFLRKLLRDVPLGAIFKHLRAGRIRVDGARCKPEMRLVEGMRVSLQLAEQDLAGTRVKGPRNSPRDQAGPRPLAGRSVPVELRPRIVFRDEDLLVVDKPAGLLVQGAKRNEANLTAWLDHKRLGLRTATFAPAPAHRLDRGTSGLVAIGLSPRGLRGLTEAFRDGRTEKVYLAVVEGQPVDAAGSICEPLLEVRAESAVGARVRVDAAGRAAHTEYELAAELEGRALLRLRLHTGRKHQLRAHLAHVGHPIVGDVRYGARARRDGRFLLHAFRLALPHPVSGEWMEFEAAPPADFPVG